MEIVMCYKIIFVMKNLEMAISVTSIFIKVVIVFEAKVMW